MKTMKITLALVLIAALLCGCGAGMKMSDLAGDWTMTAVSDAEEAGYLMDMIELYEEERAAVGDIPLEYVAGARFDEEGNYSFYYDVEANKECVRTFYVAVVDALYENRSQLADVYGSEVNDMTQEEFRAFYGLAYGFANYDIMITRFVENAYDYAVLEEPLETGTFKIVGNSLLCTITGETEAESLGCELSGDSLKLIYADAEEVYTRVK